MTAGDIKQELLNHPVVDQEDPAIENYTAKLDELVEAVRAETVEPVPLAYEASAVVFLQKRADGSLHVETSRYGQYRDVVQIDTELVRRTFPALARRGGTPIGPTVELLRELCSAMGHDPAKAAVLVVRP